MDKDKRPYELYEPEDFKVVHLKPEDFEKLERWMKDGTVVSKLDFRTNTLILERKESCPST